MFFLFLIAAQTISGALEWLLLRRFRILETAGRPWQPSFFYVWEGAGVVGVLTGTWILKQASGRSFVELGYGSCYAARQFLSGAAWGFGTVSSFVLILVALRSYSFGLLAMSLSSTATYSVAWLVAMMGTALAGEMILHGAGLLTLADALGFWPAAGILSLLPAVLGLGSGGHGLNFANGLSTLVASLFACYTVRRTGAIWFACGFHALFDYTSLFIYGSPSRGNQGGEPIATRLLTGGFHGPRWLTGGALGIVSSWVLLPILVFVFAAYRSRSTGSIESRQPKGPD